MNLMATSSQKSIIQKKIEKGIHANTKEATNQKERKQKKKVTNNSKTTRK